MKLRRFISAILVLSTLICMCPTGVFAEDDLVPVEAPEIDAAVDVDAVEITPEADAPAEEIPAEEITAVDETEEADSYLAAESSISNPQIVSDSRMVAGQKVTYSCVWFGSYPQAEVVSSKTMMTTAISEEYLNDNDYIVDATLYSQLESATGWDSNNEITLGGNKYRRMQAADATHVEKDKSWRNPFYYWSDTTTYHYFKYQPIKWRVLSTDGSTALLLADECLDDVVWNSDEDYGNTWAASEMRSWLNSYGAADNTAGTDYSSTGFLGSAFTSTEKAAIVNGTVQNNVTDNYTDGSGTATTERIFLLSYAEIINAAYGFSASYSTPDEARPAQASTYARARGTWWSTSSSYLGSSCWWLRSAGYSSSNACNVYYIGFGDYDDCVCIDDCGARPALKINLTSSSWNYAGTVCTNGNVVVICMEHEYIDTLVEPTCTEAGYIDHTCSRCGDSYQDNETDALGHVLGDDDTCTRCGFSRSSIANPRIVSDSSMVAGQKVTYSCVWFGSYPQAEVVSGKTMMTTAVGEAYLNNNDYIVDATLYSQLESATGWDSNNEITLGGNKYRRMQAADATYVEKDKSYRDEQYYWSDTTTYHYFKYQPVKWRVLSTDGSTALLLADECLDDIRWNSSTSCGNTWATSQIRSWLNSYGAADNTAGTDYSSTGFLGSAFTSAEKAAIVNGTVQNNVTGNDIDGSGTDTTDRIFLLSWVESINAAYGFSTDYSIADEARRAQASTYARAQGIWWRTNSLYFGNSWWWLRSAGSSSYFARYVYDGGYSDYGRCHVNFSYNGARPALKINLTSSSWNCAGTVCTDGNVAVICMEHEYIDTLVEPTCTEAGYTDHTCSRCGDSYQDNETDALGHVFGDDDTCTRCGASSHTGAKDDEIPLTLGVTQTATITTGDSYLYYVFTPSCSCNYTFYSTGSHDTYGYLYDSSYSQLTSNGDSGTGSNFKYTYTLTAGEKYYFGARFYSSSTTGSFDVTVDILHNYETATVEPTCTEVGYTTYTCSICGDTYTADEVPATGHSYTDAVTAPTETNRGYTTHTCSVCGHSYVDSYTDPIVTVKTGWQKIDGKWYYYNTDGTMATGWKKISGKWYYFKSTGVMATGWQKLSGKWYYLKSSGEMATGLLKIGTSTYYFDASGVMKTGWQTIDERHYFFASSGAMVIGWQVVDEKQYYFDEAGVMATEWQEIGEKQYYFDAEGVMATGWLKLDGKWYYFDAEGVMATGWLKIDGKWYYFQSTGVMKTGWLKLSGKWYYLQSSGAMKTGWLKLSGKWYWFNSSGVMAANKTVTISGKAYNFDANGVCTNP